MATRPAGTTRSTNRLISVLSLVVIALATTSVLTSPLAADVEPDMHSCAPSNLGDLCVTPGGQHEDMYCEATSGAGECKTCINEVGWVCYSQWWPDNPNYSELPPK